MHHTGERFEQGRVIARAGCAGRGNRFCRTTGAGMTNTTERAEDFFLHHVRAQVPEFAAAEVASEAGGAVDPHDRLADIKGRGVRTDASDDAGRNGGRTGRAWESADGLRERFAVGAADQLLDAQHDLPGIRPGQRCFP